MFVASTGTFIVKYKRSKTDSFHAHLSAFCRKTRLRYPNPKLVHALNWVHTDSLQKWGNWKRLDLPRQETASGWFSFEKKVTDLQPLGKQSFRSSRMRLSHMHTRQRRIVFPWCNNFSETIWLIKPIKSYPYIYSTLPMAALTTYSTWSNNKISYKYYWYYIFFIMLTIIINKSKIKNNVF